MQKQAKKTDFKNKHFPLIITDWSGVISDDRHIVYEANKILSARYGVAPNSFEGFLLASHASCSSYFRSLGIEFDPETIEAEHAEVLSHLREQGHKPVVYADAHAFLRNIGARIVVVSSHPEEHLLREAEEYGVAQHIEAFVGGAQDKGVHIKKFIDEAGLAPHEVIYMGDMVPDIHAAKRVGTLSIGVATGYHSRARLEAEAPHAVVDSLTELLELLGK